MSAFGGKADITILTAPRQSTPYSKVWSVLRNEAFFIARSLRRLRRPLGSQGLQFPARRGSEKLGCDVFVVMALLPGGGLGSAESLFSLEGVDEHAAAAVFVWNQCGPCEIKARGPRGDSKKRPSQDLRSAVAAQA
jgi:hypothetical protein